jgi:hypothetical protein
MIGFEEEITIFRFKFTEDYMKELFHFSKIHQYDNRNDFKDAWLVWIEENKEIIQEEIKRLEYNGYRGNIINKMFKSARYYFRKKSPQKKEPKARRIYINLDKTILNKMDIHIKENIKKEDYKPKVGFISFCMENESTLKDSIEHIFKQGVKDLKVIQDKMKKTYKNRYFIYIKSISK